MDAGVDRIQQLISQAKRGDPDAFGVLASEHEARLYGQAFALAGRADRAQDLVVETLAEAWRALPRFRGQCRLSTWLYGILLHRHLKELRRRRSRPVPLSDLPSAQAREQETALAQLADPGPGAHEELERRERAARLRDAVARIPEAQRLVLLLRFDAGASLGEIAAVLGVPTGTVKSRLHHAFDRLRQDVNLRDLTGDTKT